MPKTRKVKKNIHKKKGQKGGAYGNTMNSMTNNAKANMGFGYSGPIKYNHCGGAKPLPEPTVIFNNRVGYGYNQSGSTIASDVQGSYAPVSRYVASQCGAGKKAKKAKKSHKNKSKKNKTRKSIKKSKKSKKHKKMSKKINKKKTVKRKHKGKKHNQKGGSGYSQYQSNTPLGSSFESPNVNGAPLNALGPLSVSKTNINCIDNYNHYKK